MSRCCSAAPRSPARYVERDLREIYDGRLFYGRDAFEGLHTLDRLMQMKRSGEWDPEFGKVPGGRNLPLRRSQRPVRRVDRAPAPLARRRGRQPGVHATVPRLADREGPVARRHRRLRQRDGAVPQPVAVPARERRDRRRVQGPHPPDPPRAARRGQGQSACSCRRSCTGTSRPTATATTSWSGPTRPARPSPARFHYPRQQVEPFLCIADFFRPLESGEVDYAAFHIVTMGAAVSARRRPSCSPSNRVPGVPAAARPRRGDGRGAGRVLAPAHPRGVGLRRRGRPERAAGCSASSTAAAGTRGATRPAPTSRTTPPSPRCSAPIGSASR